MMGFRSTLTLLKDFLRALFCGSGVKRTIQSWEYKASSTWSRVWPGFFKGRGVTPGYLPDCLCILFLLTDIINERGMGWGRGEEAGLQMSQVPIRAEDAVYKSQWPIQNNAGDRYIKEIFKEVSHQAIVF